MEDLKTLYQSISKSFGLPSLTRFITDQFKEALSELQEIDSTLTEIGKTANLTDSELEVLGNTAFEVASKFGISANEYLTNFKRMTDAGYQNAAQMAELLTLVQSADKLQSDLAKRYLLSADQIYNYAGNVEKLTAFLDGQNQMARENTISMEELANATITASSLLSELPSVSENELSALLGTALFATKDSGREVASALGEILKKLNELNKVTPPIEQLKELAEAYNALPDGDSKKADLLSGIVSDTSLGVLKGILSNWNQYEKMLGDYAGSSGAMFRDASISAESLESALQTLSNTWTETVGNITDSEGLTAAVDAFNSLLGGANKLTDVLGPSGTISALLGGILGAKGLGLTVSYMS